MHQLLFKKELVIRPLLQRPLIAAFSPISSSQSRYYTGKTEGNIRAGKTVFSTKEKAIEDQWIKTHDAEKIKHLYEELMKQKKKIDELEGHIDEIKSKKE
ncbi:3048_t:CDS:2 [Entrophospora sp. SA101]|nr:12037_t:CDS:2 [Entrophospora sp. SA101]CAJ0750024.1 22930_t:CDS:2 [Entrophospora sp. SA101]CAJ0761727.1 3048_t:CDS:2 [Entrophospora sp. SA101]CAJ0833000.1 13922_t:CDS:2 [Entrophospora sp. SA101]